MKKRLLLIIMAAMFFITSSALAAGTVTQVLTPISKDMYKLVFTCTGDASDGSIPDTDTTDGRIYGMYLYRIVIVNTSSQTDTDDDADVYILDSNDTDLLNAQGVDKLDKDVANYIRINRKDPVLGTLTLDVDNQSQTSAVYTITLILAK